MTSMKKIEPKPATARLCKYLQSKWDIKCNLIVNYSDKSTCSLVIITKLNCGVFKIFCTF